MNPWINYHHLYYFKTFAELGSVSKAAEKLNIGQPTLSAQLKQFEENLGVRLFERQHKKLLLTEQGLLALDYARNIFKMGGEMYEALHDRLKPSKLHLHLGALDGVPKQVVLELSKFAYQNGPCTVTLTEGRFAELISDVMAHRIDIAVTNFPPPPEMAKFLFQRSFSKETVSVYGSPKFRHLKKGFPQSLQHQRFVLPTYDSQLRYAIDHWVHSKKIQIDVVAETQDSSLQSLMATNEMALIPAAKHTVADELEAKMLIEIGQIPSASEELFLITAKRRIDNPIAAALMKSFTF